MTLTRMEMKFILINIINSFGYDGYIGIEYEGSSVDEYSGIEETKNLLEKVKTFT